MRVVRESRRVAGLWKGFLRVDEEFHGWCLCLQDQ